MRDHEAWEWLEECFDDVDGAAIGDLVQTLVNERLDLWFDWSDAPWGHWSADEAAHSGVNRRIHHDDCAALFRTSHCICIGSQALSRGEGLDVAHSGEHVSEPRKNPKLPVVRMIHTMSRVGVTELPVRRIRIPPCLAAAELVQVGVRCSHR